MTTRHREIPINYISVSEQKTREQIEALLPPEICESIIWRNSGTQQKFDYNLRIDEHPDCAEDELFGFKIAAHRLKKLWRPGFRIYCTVMKSRHFHDQSKQRYGTPLETGYYEYTMLYYTLALSQ